jgi:hypothetical protein
MNWCQKLTYEHFIAATSTGELTGSGCIGPGGDMFEEI